jgi:hypothetical protein
MAARVVGFVLRLWGKPVILVIPEHTACPDSPFSTRPLHHPGSSARAWHHFQSIQGLKLRLQGNEVLGAALQKVWQCVCGWELAPAACLGRRAGRPSTSTPLQDWMMTMPKPHTSTLSRSRPQWLAKVSVCADHKAQYSVCPIS